MQLCCTPLKHNWKRSDSSFKSWEEWLVLGILRTGRTFMSLDRSSSSSWGSRILILYFGPQILALILGLTNRGDNLRDGGQHSQQLLLLLSAPTGGRLVLGTNGAHQLAVGGVEGAQQGVSLTALRLGAPRLHHGGHLEVNQGKVLLVVVVMGVRVGTRVGWTRLMREIMLAIDAADRVEGATGGGKCGGARARLRSCLPLNGSCLWRATRWR